MPKQRPTADEIQLDYEARSEQIRPRLSVSAQPMIESSDDLEEIQYRLMSLKDRGDVTALMQLVGYVNTLAMQALADS